MTFVAKHSENKNSTASPILSPPYFTSPHSRPLFFNLSVLLDKDVMIEMLFAKALGSRKKNDTGRG